ncbi:hypothetical protein O1611_g1802 [Lasiodiplodia mahajangana]|uniref:Uncharacterized protein n=1 Tax=Lasiodiplodia mahajangana TaxID=1108764 RepID=A0ACC2JWV3_9PEZI|nr:hypothetical protein O1611_g1802 [Lasiodiplodia mahajangana]
MSVCTVSNQADADKANSSCSAIVIHAAEGALNFSTLDATQTITVENTPALETLHFPKLRGLHTLSIANSTALKTVSLPLLSASTIEYEGSDAYFQAGSLLNLDISNAPNLSTLELRNLTSLGNVALIDTQAPYAYSDLGSNNVSAALSIRTDSLVTFNELQDVGELQIAAPPGFDYGLYNLRSAGNITISNASRLFALVFGSDNSPQLPPIKINESLVLESAVPPDPIFNENRILFSRITTVGANLSISTVSDLYLDFEGLTDVGGDISLVGNTNCSWNFGQVTGAGSLTILDNENTAIPLFPQLQTVGDIHLRGNIDTSTGPNIFPTLVLARGNVTIEPWNADFNCSKLVSQWQDGLINHLSCNGTGGTNATAKFEGGSGLSPGALAGIGVGTGVFGLLLIGTIVWFAVRRRRRQKVFEMAHPPTWHTGYERRASTPGPSHISVIHEVDGAGIVREKPHDPITPELPALGPYFQLST